MKDLQLNGIRITVATRAEAQELGLKRYLDLGNGLVLVAPPGITVKTLIILAGHDWAKIDPAVPLDWAYVAGRDGLVQRHDPNKWVWSYEHDPIFGEPLSLWKVRREVAQQIMELLVSHSSPEPSAS